MRTIEEQVQQLRSNLVTEAEKVAAGVVDEVSLTLATRYTLGDAIREGATVSEQAYNWTDGEGRMCAMSAAIVAAQARGYMQG